MSISDDFHTDSRPLVADTITGVRSFNVDRLGRLTGVTQKSVWRPGLNEAKCPANLGPIQRAALKAERDMRQRNGFAIHTMWGSDKYRYVDTPEHTPGSAGCQCGFWAYFDGSNDYEDSSRVTAIVEGQGVVTVGTKGFRAEKAEIVALVDPTKKTKRELTRWHRTYDKFADWTDRTMPLAAFAIGFVVMSAIPTFVGAADAVSDRSWWAVPLFVLFAAIAAIGVFTVRAIGHGLNRQYPSLHQDFPCLATEKKSEVPWEAIRRNYPDVPVYGSLKDALAAHPLSQPVAEPISPETVPDFWERSC